MSPDGAQLREIWDALSRLRIGADDLVIVLSPHSIATGVYEGLQGSLSAFGLPHIAGTFAAAPTESMALDRLDGPLDHGAFVPLMLLKPVNEVMVFGLGADLITSDAVDMVRDVAKHRDVFVLVSAHTSVRLTERAPLPYSFEAVRSETRFITNVEKDCAVASEMAEGFGRVGGSCSATTLRAFGELFAGAEGTVLAYGSPFGVGYPVITAEVDA